MSHDVAQFRVMIERGEIDAARARLREFIAIKANEGNVEARLLLAGITRLEANRRLHYTVVLSLDPNNPEALRELALLNGEPPPSGPAANGPLGGAPEEPAEPDEDEGAGPQPGQRPRPGQPKGYNWNHPFLAWRDVLQGLPDYTARVLSYAQQAQFERSRQAETLRLQSLAPDLSYGDPAAQQTLRAIIAAAGGVGERMLSQGMLCEAFWVFSIFGEMAKALRDQDLYRRQLLNACRAISEDWLRKDPHAELNQTSEIKALQRRLTAVLSRATGTFFREGRFLNSHRSADMLIEDRVSHALSQHFARRLQQLLDQDRDGVRPYVIANLPHVYRLRLDPAQAGVTFDRWEAMLREAGFDEVLIALRDTGVVRSDKVGLVADATLEQLRGAVGHNDLARADELLRPIARETRIYLEHELEARLVYHEPPLPSFPGQRGQGGRPQARRPRTPQDDPRKAFADLRRLAESGDRDKLRLANQRLSQLLREHLDNRQLREWQAYLEARLENPVAEEMFEALRQSQGKVSFESSWNQAVLAFYRRDYRKACTIIEASLDDPDTGDDVRLVIMALALRLRDEQRFLDQLGAQLTLRFHPLAVVVALDSSRNDLAQALLRELIRQGADGWMLPDPERVYRGLKQLWDDVTQAIVRGQVDRVIAWLERRVERNRTWVPNYIALARVYEHEKRDVDRAFQAMCGRVEAQLRQNQRDQMRIDEACRELFEFCQRYRRGDLLSQAYGLCERAGANAALLQTIASLRGREQPDQAQPSLKPAPLSNGLPPPAVSGPGGQSASAARLAAVSAALAEIDSVESYVRRVGAVQELCDLLRRSDPSESEKLIRIIDGISSILVAFPHSDDGSQRELRESGYLRITNYQRRLADLLSDRYLPRALADLAGPYLRAVRGLMGDLSRLAGVGPDIVATIANSFISAEAPRTTLVLIVENRSEDAASDIGVELRVDPGVFRLAPDDRPGRTIRQLPPHQRQIQSFALERVGDAGGAEVSVSISLRASAGDYTDADLGITGRIPVRTLQEASGQAQIPRLFQSGLPLKPGDPGPFRGRDDILGKIRNSFYGGVQRERFFLDGLRRVGKTSILNYLPQYLPESVLPVYVNLDLFGSLSGSASSALILRQIAGLIRDRFAERGIRADLPEPAQFESDPAQSFTRFLGALRAANPATVPLLMIDEFQDLLYAAARSGNGREPETMVPDLLRGLSDDGRLYLLLTGSLRFEKLSGILNTKLFGSLSRLRLGFLTAESVAEVLCAGLQPWVTVLPETAQRVHELSGGYPWLVQTYGAGIVDLLNGERRAVVTPADIDRITRDSILCNDENFSYWWPVAQLGHDEERLVERLLRDYPEEPPVSIRQFLSDHARDKPAFLRALDNLRDCEVLDPTRREELRFSGRALREWLKLKMQDDNRLELRSRQGGSLAAPPADPGYAGIFIDHENLIRTLVRISINRGRNPHAQLTQWFDTVLEGLLDEATRRVGPLKYRYTVAFWSRPQESSLISPYLRLGFILQQPEEVKLENAVDFKLVDMVHTANHQALRESSRLARAIIVTGDGDLSHNVRTLLNEGVEVQIWGGSLELSSSYRRIIGQEQIIALEDITRL